MWDSKQKVLEYGKRLVGKSLRAVEGKKPLGEKELESVMGGGNRHSFGYLLEQFYYDIHPGNSSEPDFKEIGLELKSTPIKSGKKGFVSKERLVLNAINYIDEFDATFESSSYLRKNARIMLVSYLHESGQFVADLNILLAELLEFDHLPEEDRKIIREDWEKIHAKIASNKAHELSEGDTFYLGACTKAATSKNRTPQRDGTLAKPRAYSLKGGYMTALTKRFLEKAEVGERIVDDDEIRSEKTFEDIVLDRFSPFVGKTVDEIHQIVAHDVDPNASKNYLAVLARRIMRVKGEKIVEFEKAEVQMKTIQLKSSGMPKESMSFPTFKSKELVLEDWDTEPVDAEIDDLQQPSTFKQQLEKRFFLVIFKCEKDCKGGECKVLEKVMFWTMPIQDLESVVRKTWESAIKAIKSGDIAMLPKISDNFVIHVRPHAKDSKDVDVLPNGEEMTKRCFWLNAEYLKKVVEGD